MTYENLAKTFDIISSKDPTGVVIDWAGHDEYGIKLNRIELMPAEVRQLAEMGWGLGSDSEYDEERMAAWYHPSEHTDEELMELWRNYKSIYKHA